MSELITLAVTAVALRVTGAVLATAVRILDQGLSATARTAFRELTRGVPEQTRTVSAPARATAAPMPERVRALGLSPDEARGLAELVQVAALPVDDPERLRDDLRNTPVERWPEVVRAAHARAFVQSLTAAAVQACRGIGFDRVEVLGNRIQAQDGSGRALVVEVEPEGVLRAEVLGTADPSCHQVIDGFLRGLQENGVEFRDPRREPTAGMPATEAGREWVRRRYGIRREVPSSGGSRTRPASVSRVTIGRYKP